MKDVKLQTFDKDMMMANFQGLEDLAFDSIESFLSTLPSLVSEIESAINSKSASQLELASHTLKGVVSNFYAEPSRLLAWKLEQIGHTQRTTGAEKIFVEMKIELDALQRELNSLLNKRKAS